MNAAVYQGNGRIDLEPHEPKPVGNLDIRLRVEAAGICGTDVHILRGEYDSSPPVVLGHEFAGTVTQLGEQVSHIHLGESVSVEPHLYCGICKHCVNGQEHRCIDKKAFGVHLDGGFAQEVTVPARNAYRLPEGMSCAVGALAEPLGCAVHGVDQADIGVGDDVAIFGGGPMGLLLTELVSKAGARHVIVVEPNEQRRKIALTFGATQALHPDEAPSAIEEATEGYGLDVTFEATGLPNVLNSALTALGRGGRLVVFGVAAPTSTLAIAPYRIYRDELTIIGSLTNPYAHKRAVHLLSTLDLTPLTSHTFKLLEFGAALDIAKRGEGLKIQIAPHT